MATGAHNKHGFRCWLRWPRWRDRFDPGTHQTVSVCTKCGSTKVSYVEDVGKMGGGAWPS
jgi:hypothetical protein